ncbi:PDR/VanB family oxidoreductase [Amycolatopsis sp. H20-H5]|uniref:PDR/VanB family oxidoreductase n=1 Tax=Amycolatopsis sp. H20-H5 TaxID=3046309 RepID=UPI002DB72EE6|nr:PDR/VanB family oxidoreductase [Amycolatopsis sp. H20-H5]MEC3975730.1 PDR/VanB family oxidoreductase [Amycolatopsis sp. H20-H5]
MTEQPSATVRTLRQGSTELTLTAQEFEIAALVGAKGAASAGVATLELRRVDGGPFPRWEPGAHIDLILDAAPTRQYSLCGDPADRSSYRIGVLLDPAGQGSSRYVHERMQVGDAARIRGPRNNFPLAKSPRYIFIAGGIGITPLLPMIAEAEAAGAEWRLVYGGRERASMAFLPELEPYSDRVSVRPQDETGLLDLEEVLGSPAGDTLVYCCGPEPLLVAVEARCAAWPPGALHVERFSPRPIEEAAGSEPFEIVLEQSGVTLAVPADRSILDVVDEAGVFVLSSCREGTCGTCETGVLSGEPDHRDSVLGPVERESNQSMMICVSRAKSPQLSLDL